MNATEQSKAEERYLARSTPGHQIKQMTFSGNIQSDTISSSASHDKPLISPQQYKPRVNQEQYCALWGSSVNGNDVTPKAFINWNCLERLDWNHIMADIVLVQKSEESALRFLKPALGVLSIEWQKNVFQLGL